MTKFAEEVRNSRVSQPTQKSFSREKWDKAYKGSDDPDPEDTRIYNAGIWFDKKLKQVRIKLMEFHQVRLNREFWAKLYVALVNRDYAVGTSAMQKQLAEVKVLEAGYLSRSRVPGGHDGAYISAIGHLEAAVSALRNVLSALPSASSDRSFREIPDGHFKIPHLWPGQNPPPRATVGQ